MRMSDIDWSKIATELLNGSCALGGCYGGTYVISSEYGVFRAVDNRPWEKIDTTTHMV